MKRLIGTLLTAALLFGVAGCGTLIPKKVEIGQDKVEKFPTPRWREREVQKEAAQRVKEKAREVVLNGVKENVPDSVLAPAKEVEQVADAIADVLGPPASRADEESPNLADKVRSVVAKQDRRVDEFAKENDTNAGKKIEGTGLIQVSYFAWVGGFLALLFLGYLALKVLSTLGSLANPAVGVGANLLSFTAKGAGRALAQVVKGGQNFKKLLDERITSDATKKEILELFRVAQNKAQDEDVQDAIKKLTK